MLTIRIWKRSLILFWKHGSPIRLGKIQYMGPSKKLAWTLHRNQMCINIAYQKSITEPPYSSAQILSLSKTGNISMWRKGRQGITFYIELVVIMSTDQIHINWQPLLNSGSKIIHLKQNQSWFTIKILVTVLIFSNNQITWEVVSKKFTGGDERPKGRGISLK